VARGRVRGGGREVDAAAAAETARGLEIAARAVAQRWRAGRHAATGPGEADEFYEFRRVGPGETAARVDWRASARRDEPVSSVRRRLASMTVAVAVDSSASMGFRGLGAAPTDPSKLDAARLLAAAVIAAVLARGDRAALVAGDAPVEPAAPGRSGLVRACDRLARLTPAGREPLSALLDRARAEAPAADLIVAVSDALEPVEALARAASRITRRRGGPRDLALIRVLTADEIAPPATPGALVDPETGARASVRDSASAARAARAVEAHTRAVSRVFSGPGRRCGLHIVGEGPASTLAALFARRPAQ